MKRVRNISVLLICFLASAPFIMPACFIASRLMIRAEMKERMEKQNLSVVLVPVADFQWYEKDKEILVNGKMFDVQSIRLSGENYIVTGLFDEQETELEQALQKKMEHHENGSDIPQLLIQICTSTADLDVFKPSLNTLIPPGISYVTYMTPHCPEYCQAINIPPPKG